MRMYPHQVAALSHALARDSWAYYMEQRLGKTLPTVRALAYKGARVVLVVAPYSALRGWAETLTAEGIPYYVAAGDTVVARDVRASNFSGWVLCPWQILADCRMILSRKWDAAIVDESRIIANPSSRITHAVNSIRAKHHVCLSGAPATEGMHEYYTQMRFLGATWGGMNFWDWRLKWFRQSVAVRGGRWYPTKFGESHIAATVARYAYQLKRVDTPYALPEETAVRYVRLPEGSTARQYRRVEKEFVREAADGTLDLTSWAGQRLVWMRRIADGVDDTGEWTCAAKRDELQEILNGPLVNKPVIIWADYISEIAAIYTTIRERLSIVIHGAFLPETRDSRIDMWRESKNGVLIIQPQCVRYGADLSHADTAVWFSVPASLDVWLQARERTRKIGVHACTYTYVIVTESTVDEDIYNALRDKDSDALRAGALVRAAAQRKESPEWWRTASGPK